MAESAWGVMTAVIAVVTLPLGLIAGLFLGFEFAAIVFIVGWFLLVPLLPILGHHVVPMIREWRNVKEVDEEGRDPTDELKRQYVRGEIDDVEFERRVSRLFEVDEAELRSDDGPTENRVERESE